MSLLNVFTKMTKGIKSLITPKASSQNIPVNEDWAFVTDITQFDEYDEGVKVVKGTKVWDESVSKKIFSAYAKYLGNNGSPPGSENVQVGTKAVFLRTGEGEGEANFISIFANARHACCDGIPALVVVRAPGGGVSQGVTSCYKVAGGTYYGGVPPRFQRIVSYNIVKQAGLEYIEILALDSKKIVVASGFSPTVQWDEVNTGGTQCKVSDTFYDVGTFKLVPGIANFGAGDETCWVIKSAATSINPHAECCVLSSFKVRVTYCDGHTDQYILPQVGGGPPYTYAAGNATLAWEAATPNRWSFRLDVPFGYTRFEHTSAYNDPTGYYEERTAYITVPDNDLLSFICDIKSVEVMPPSAASSGAAPVIHYCCPHTVVQHVVFAPPFPGQRFTTLVLDPPCTRPQETQCVWFGLSVVGAYWVTTFDVLGFTKYWRRPTASGFYGTYSPQTPGVDDWTGLTTISLVEITP